MLYLLEFVLGVSLIYGLARCHRTTGVMVTSLAIAELCCAFASAMPLPTYHCTPYEASIRAAPIFLGVVLLAGTIIQLMQNRVLPSCVNLSGAVGWVVLHRAPVFSELEIGRDCMGSGALCLAYLCAAMALLLLHSGVGSSYMFDVEIGVGIMVMSVLPSFVVALMAKYFALFTIDTAVVVGLQVAAVLLPIAVCHALTKMENSEHSGDGNC